MIMKIPRPTGTNTHRVEQSLERWLHDTGRVPTRGKPVVTDEVFAGFVRHLEGEALAVVQRLEHIGVVTNETHS